jgi:hypothetical protein
MLAEIGPRVQRLRAERTTVEVMRGDRVEIVIDAGQEVRTYEVVATRVGRRVEINTSRGVVEVTEVTRGGTPVRTAGSWRTASSPWSNIPLPRRTSPRK